MPPSREKSTPEDEDNNRLPLILGVTIAVIFVAVLAAVVVFVFVIWRVKRTKTVAEDGSNRRDETIQNPTYDGQS